LIGLDGSTTLWTLHRHGHTVRADVGQHPLGLELRFFWNGDLYFSRVFREDGDELLQESEAKRTELAGKGWQ
jgi:hypothetical protein